MAAIGFKYSEQATATTFTNSAWAAPSNACEIAAVDLKNSTNYLVIAKGLIGGSNANNFYGIKVVTADDSDVEADSQHSLEVGQTASDSLRSYLWIGEYTTAASASKLEIQVQSFSGNNGYVDQLALLVIELDELTYVRSQRHQSAGPNQDIGTTTWGDTLASIGSGSLSADTEYLVLGTAQIDVDDNKTQFHLRLRGDVDADDVLEQLTYASEEGEDANEWRIESVMGRVLTDASPSVGIDIQAYADAANDYDYGYTYLIAIETATFANFEYVFAATGSTITGTPASPTTLATLSSFAPVTSGDHLLLGRFNYTVGGNDARTSGQITYNGTSILTGDIDKYQTHQWDATDGASVNVMAVESLSATADIDLDGAAHASDSDPTSEYEFLAVLDLELASAGTSWTEEIEVAPVVAVTLPLAVRKGGAQRTATLTPTVDVPLATRRAAKTVFPAAVQVTTDVPLAVRQGGAQRTVTFTVQVQVPLAVRKGDANRVLTAVAVNVTVPKATAGAAVTVEPAAVQVATQLPQAVRSGGALRIASQTLPVLIPQVVRQGDASRVLTAVVVNVTVPLADTDVTTVRSPAALNLPVTVPQAVRSGDANRTVAATTVTLSLPLAGTDVTTVRAAPAVVVATAVPLTVVSGGALRVLSAVAVNLAVPQVDRQADRTVVVAAVLVDVAVPLVTISTGGAPVTVQPDAVVVAVAVPLVTIDAGGAPVTVQPAAVVVDVQIPQAVRSGGATRTAGLTVAFTFPQVTRTAGASRVVVFTVTVQIPQATRTASRTLTPQVATVNVTLPQASTDVTTVRPAPAVVVALAAPQVVRQGGAVRIALVTVDISIPLVTLVIPINATSQPAALVVGVTVPQVSISTGSTVTLTPLTVPVTFPQTTPFIQRFVAVVPVTVSLTLPASSLTTEISATARPVPIVLSSSFVPFTLWTGLIDIDVPETGLMWRDPADPMLSLGYGGRRSMTRTWANTDEAWERVSVPFLFQSTANGKAQIDSALIGEWVVHKAASRLVLLAAVCQALQNAGFRRPDGSDIVSHSKQDESTLTTGVSVPQVTVTTT